MTPRRCLHCYRLRPEADLRQAGQAWYCAPRCEPTGKMVPCLRCGRLLPEADAARELSGAGHYHKDCAGPWCYSRERHKALVELHQGGELVWRDGWRRPDRREGDDPPRLCGDETMGELRRDGIVIRLGDRRILAPHLRKP